MNLKELRAKIDLLDNELLDIITERIKLAAQTRRLKEIIPDPKRESEIVSRAQRRLPPFFEGDFAQNLYNVIFAEARRLQHEAAPIVAVYPSFGEGEDFLFRCWNKDWIPVAVGDLALAIEGLNSGAFAYAVLKADLIVATNSEAITEELCAKNLPIISRIDLTDKQPHLAKQDVISYFLVALPGREQAGDRCLVTCSTPKGEDASADKIKGVFFELGLEPQILNTRPNRRENSLDIHLIDFSEALKGGIVETVLERLKFAGFNPHMLGRYSVVLVPNVP